jgi:hypothetical protein
MARVRYETHCGGRLLKVFQQVEVPDSAGPPYPTAEAAAEATARYRAENDVPVVDGMHWWMVDLERVSPDVARAMLAEYGEQP